LEAKRYGFCNVTVNPAYVSVAAKELTGSGVKVGCVVAFPLGASTTEIKVAEALRGLQDGAEELDMVMNVGRMLSGRTDEVLSEEKAVVGAVKKLNPQAIVKVIIEACYLSEGQKREACRLAVEAGADFVKSSTGFGPAGAKVEDIRLMRETVGPRVGVKASGGIRSLKDVLEMLNAGADRVGTSDAPAIMEEIA